MAFFVMASCVTTGTTKSDIPPGLLVRPADTDVQPYPPGCNPSVEPCGFCWDAEQAADWAEYLYKLEQWIEKNGK